MMRRLIAFGVAAALGLAVPAGIASAHDYRYRRHFGGRHRHWHGRYRPYRYHRRRSRVHFYFYGAPYPYYRPYYEREVYIYEPAPAPPYVLAGGKQGLGAILGGIAGGVLGAQIGKGRGRTAAIVGGSLLGILIGGEMGRQMDERDRLLMTRSTQTTLETTRTGEVSRWVNPDTGHGGTIQPTYTYKSSDGRYCREFQQTVTIGGRTERAYGTACRQPDGSWKIVDR